MRDEKLRAQQEQTILGLAQFDEYVGQLQFKIKKVHGNDRRRLFQALLLYFLIRARQTYQATLRLLDLGFATEAAVLARTLIEMAISAEYMAKEPEVRAGRFVEFDTVRRFKWAHGAKSAGVAIDDAALDRVKTEAEKVMAKHKGHKSKTWSAQVKEMAEEVGMKKSYYVSYVKLCDHAHTGPSQVDEVVAMKEDASVELNWQSSQKPWRDAAFAVIHHLHRIAARVSEEFKLGAAEELGKRQGEFLEEFLKDA